MRPLKVVALVAVDELRVDLRAMQLAVWRYDVVYLSEKRPAVQPACVLLDGLTDAKWVRRVKRWWPDVPVLVVGFPEHRAAMSKAGADMVLSDTVHASEVGETLAMLCARRRGPKTAEGLLHPKNYVRWRTERLMGERAA